MQLRVGTSGFSYKAWKGSFYPEKLPASGMLAYYAERLRTVEINNTFYRMPKQSVLEGWAAAVPEDFRFAIKASRRITHMKRLKEVEDETAYLLGQLQWLGDKLGVVLFQLPPNLAAHRERLERFFDLLPAALPCAFEFRHPSWLEGEVPGLLRERGAALCLTDTDDEPVGALDADAPLGYLRLRRSAYTSAQLDAFAGRLQQACFREGFVFLKHEGEAPHYAAELQARCSKGVRSVRPTASARGSRGSKAG